METPVWIGGGEVGGGHVNGTSANVPRTMIYVTNPRHYSVDVRSMCRDQCPIIIKHSIYVILGRLEWHRKQKNRNGSFGRYPWTSTVEKEHSPWPI